MKLPVKVQIQIITLIAIGFGTLQAHAEPPVSKPALRVDFNQMIEENNAHGQDLHQDIRHATDARTLRPTRKSDKDKAIDFIDVEVGIGQAPSVVDRRFDTQVLIED